MAGVGRVVGWGGGRDQCWLAFFQDTLAGVGLGGSRVGPDMTIKKKTK